jgi:hypothetical protein
MAAWVPGRDLPVAALVPQNIYGGLILFEREAAGDLFRYFDRFINDAPREYGGYPAWHLAPPLPFIPADDQAKVRDNFGAG